MIIARDINVAAPATPVAPAADVAAVLGVPSDAAFAALVAQASADLEADLGVFFTPRTVTETIALASAVSLHLLAHPQARTITSVTADGALLDPSAYLTLATSGVIRSTSENALANTSLVVVYTAGYPTAPPEIVRALADIVKAMTDTRAAGAVVESETLEDVGEVTYASVMARGTLSSLTRGTLARYRVRRIY